MRSNFVFYCREYGYRVYAVDREINLLYRSFVNVYFGAVYFKWLLSFEYK